MVNDVNDIAAKWNAVFGQPEEPTTEPDAEPVGKGNVIPSAGHQPELNVAQQIALSGGSETDAKHRYLAELIQRNH